MAKDSHVSAVRPGAAADALQSYEETVPNAGSRIQAAGLCHRVRQLQQDTAGHKEELYR